MKRTSLSGVVRFIGLGFVLIGVVVLLTLLFNFLGTISCAALAGMMFGASKQWRWRGSFVSLVFPAVMAAFLYFGKNDFPLRQSVLLSLVCFGAFWVTFLLTVAAPYLEQQRASSPAGQTVSSETSKLKLAADSHNEKRINPPALAPAKAGALGPPNLDELQGIWSREATAGEPSHCRKMIEVTRSQLTLRVLGPDNEVRFVCRGHVKLERLGPFKMLSLVDPQPASTDSAEVYGLPGTWIYQVVGETLSVASHFEDALAGRAPAVEVFKRCRQAERSRNADAHRCAASDQPN